MRKRIITGTLGILLVGSLCGCTLYGQSSTQAETTEQAAIEDGSKISLSDDRITSEDPTVAVENQVVTITQAGTYVLSGKLTDGRLVVDTDKEAEVTLILNGVDITCSDYACLRVEQAGMVTIQPADGTENELTDGSSYTLADEDDGTDGVIFSKDDLKLEGSGTLYVTGNYGHGIVGKDTLEINGGTYIIQAKEDGINANDAITINDGILHISAGDDGIHVDEVLTVNDGAITVAESYEGLEGHQVIINGGDIDITASDDGINSNSGENGSQSEDRADMPADMTPPDDMGDRADMPTDMTPPDDMGDRADMPTDMTPPDDIGDRADMPTDMTPPDDMGDWADMPTDMTPPDDTGDRTDMPTDMTPPGGMGGGMGMDMDADEDSLLQINGGTILVNAGGDGLDSNGILEMTGGTVYVSGAANNGDGALDYGIKATISGGTILAAGYQGMEAGFDSASEQYSRIYHTSELQDADTNVVIYDADGSEILSWTVPKEFNSIVISAPEIKEDGTYTIKVGDQEDTL